MKTKEELILRVLDKIDSVTLNDIEELMIVAKTEDLQDEIIARLQKEVTEYIKNKNTDEVVTWLIKKIVKKELDFVLASIALRILTLGLSEEDKDFYSKMSKINLDNIRTYNEKEI